jgi:hypothetical protein
VGRDRLHISQVNLSKVGEKKKKEKKRSCWGPVIIVINLVSKNSPVRFWFFTYFYVSIIFVVFFFLVKVCNHNLCKLRNSKHVES